MEDTEPSFRAPIVKSVLSAIEQTPQARDVLERLSERRLGEIRGAARGGWVPVSWLVELYAALMAVSGEMGLRAFGRRHSYHVYDLPMVGPIVRAAVNTFGGGPRTLLRVLPRVTAASARDVGRQEVTLAQDGARRASVRWRELPHALRQRSWLVAQAAQYHGLLDLGGAEGQVSLDDRELAAGVASFAVSWEPLPRGRGAVAGARQRL